MNSQTVICAVIPIIPVPQARARHAVVNGRAMAFKSPKQRGAEADLIALLAQHRPDQPLEGPLRVEVLACLPIPASKPRRWKIAAAEGAEKPAKKPDVDNLAKHVLDCCTKLQFWRDDAQICALAISKCYSEQPRWVIRIEAA